MSDKSSNKERQRLKRQRKRATLRPGKRLTPLQRIARGDGRLTCYLNEEWQVGGLAAVYVLGTTPDGRHAFAGFLIDLLCVGLKDAWGSANASRMEFDEVVKKWKQWHRTLEISHDDARALVAGSLRFSRQNGFRPPAHWERWTTILGDLGDVNSADLGPFARDGKLRYSGSIDFLRQRLTGCTPEEFLSRPDVEFIMGDNVAELFTGAEASEEEDDPDQQDLSELNDALQTLASGVHEARERIESSMRKWLFASGRAPHPRLSEALSVSLITMLPQAAGLVGEDTGTAESRIADIRNMLSGTHTPEEQEEVEDALAQVQDFIYQFDSPDQLLSAVDVDDDEEN